MNHTNDDPRDEFPVPAGTRPVDIALPAPATHTPPEPFVAVEPASHVAYETPHVSTPAAALDARAASPTAPLAPEPTWRSIVGTARERQSWNAPLESQDVRLNEDADGRITGEVPPSGGPPPAPLPGDDTTAGTLGEEPMGGTPREAPLLPPGVAPLAPGDPSAQDVRARHQTAPTVTLGRIGEELFAWLKTLASAAVYATLIVTFGFQVARVEGQSMAPTLADQDRLIVNKLAYRLGQPQVGDIVMLYYPLNPDKSFVKRVIAEEGDQIRIVDGRVYRNDVRIADDYVPPEFRSHDDYGPEVVPQGYYFVMGDHRNNSSDSRHWKFVPKKYIIGKVQLRWWPIPQARVF